MTGIRRSNRLAAALTALAMAGTTTAAPDANFGGDSYGRGVHAYFSGDCAAAEQLFTQAMGNDPNDPRPFYFRALCLLRQGRSDEARSDVMIGAALEARSPGSYPVGKSLERVQGGDRLLLEQFRWHVRATNARVGGVDAGSPRRATVAMHTDVGALRQKISVPLDRFVQPVSLAELANVAAERPAPAATTPTDDPFADDSQSAHGGKIPSGKLLGILGRAMVESAPIPSLEGLREQLPGLAPPATNGAVPATDDPFGSDAAGAPATDAPTTDDPFSEPPPTDDASGPAESSPAESGDQPADAAEEDPFG